eukprot:Nitzschia sp. Nitz4//scaffold53_size117307//44073//47638//NITZ4_003767-RA/size117307-processed-gene-0.29-mRNA-1//-1//CDS//3329554196//1300//frame0
MYPELTNHQQVVKSEVRHFGGESILSPTSVVRAMPVGGLPPIRPSREARWSGSESSNDTNGPPVFRGSPAPSDGRKKPVPRGQSPKRSTTSSNEPTSSGVQGFSDALDPSMDSFSLGEDDDIFDESDNNESGHSRSSGRSKRASSRGRKARKGVRKMMTNRSTHTHNSSMSSITMALGSSVDFTFEDSLTTIDFSGHHRSTSQHQPMMMSSSESRWNPVAQKASEMGLATPARGRRFSSQSLLPTLASLAGFDPDSSQDISINDSIADNCSSFLPTPATHESSTGHSTSDRCETTHQDCVQVQNNDESIVLRDFELSAQELEEESLPLPASDVQTARIADTPPVVQSPMLQLSPSEPSPVPSSPTSKHSRSSSHRRRGSLGIFGNRYRKNSDASSSDDYDAFLQAGAPGDFATWQEARRREREIPPLANSGSRPTWTASNNVLFSTNRKTKRRGSTGTLLKRLMSPSYSGDLLEQATDPLPKEDQFSIRTEHGTSCTRADGKCDFESTEGEMPLFGEMDLAKEEEERPKTKTGNKVRRRRSNGTLSNSGSSKATSSSNEANLESTTEHSASTATCNPKPKKKSNKAKRRQSTGDSSCGSSRSKKSSKSKSRRKKAAENADQFTVDGSSNHSLSTTSSHQLVGEGSQESLPSTGTNRRSMMKKKPSKWDALVDKSSKRSPKPKKSKAITGEGDNSSLCTVSKKKKSPKERLLDIAPTAPGIAVQTTAVIMLPGPKHERVMKPTLQARNKRTNDAVLHQTQHHDMVGPHRNHNRKRKRNRKRTKQLPASKRIIKSLTFCFLVCYLSVLWLTGIWHVRLTIRGDPSPSTSNVVLPLHPIRIGIASTITACGRDPYTEGAAVLKHSIDLTSYQGPKGGNYEYQFYVFYHPDALDCVRPLESLGFTLLERQTPVNVSDIRGSILRERISSNGCCGEKELIKLEVFRLTQHPVVIHMDLDTLVFQPMDPIIDFLMDPSNTNNQQQVPLMWPDKPIPQDVSMLFTKDYNLVPPKRPDKPFQGGFLAIRPSHAIYHEFVQLVLEGDYRVDEETGTGWGGQVGPFHGGMTIQGLFPWFYEYLHPDQAVELNRCIYNNMADNPRTRPSINDTAQGQCRTNEKVSQASIPVPTYL